MNDRRHPQRQRSGATWEQMDRNDRAKLRADLKRPGAEKLEETLELSRFAGELAAAGARRRTSATRGSSPG